jgi:hypothetical protein
LFQDHLFYRFVPNQGAPRISRWSACQSFWGYQNLGIGLSRILVATTAEIGQSVR